MTTEELHVAARAMVEKIKSEGGLIDKKLCRFNEIVETAQFYNNPIEGLIEAVQCCIIGHDMHVPGRGPLTLVAMYK